jgi:hypothetical protein
MAVLNKFKRSALNKKLFS